MKKIVSLLLALLLVLSFASVCAFAEEEPIKKEFVVDGVLDPWYLTVDKTDPDDMNTYHFDAFDCFVKGGAGTGSAPYDEYYVETAAEIYTAYDDNYVYFYVKVWDDELRFWNGFEPEDYDIETDSSTGDSIEIWFDPDPNSVTKYNVSDPTADPTENGKKFYFCNNTKDSRQGDVQMRLQALPHPNTGNYFVNDFHDRITNESTGEKETIYRPGYVDPEGNPIGFGDWVSNKYETNLCHFTFDNEPRLVNEYDGKTVSSGFGLEVRFPRNDDDSNSYYFNIAINNSATTRDERYAFALGSAWWTSYALGVTVDYQDVNPFFAQNVDDGNGDDPVIPDPPAPTAKPGDINGDDKVDAKDALLALRISVGKYTPTEDEKAVADVNKDEKVDAKDALEMLKYSVGKPSVLDQQ